MQPNAFSMPDVIERPLSESKARALEDAIVERLEALDAVLIAHYYVDERIQALAERTGGLVADSLDMAKFGMRQSQQTLVIAGVYFMGETASILSPEKRVIMPDLSATCSLDLGCPADAFSSFCDAHPDRTVVVYANTSAAVKARADWVVTSSIAVEVIRHLDAQGESILFAPDKHLGAYLKDQTQADILLWDGACVVHERFKADALHSLRERHPEAAVLVHPESPAAVIAQADVVGSTKALVAAVQQLPNPSFIVATDRGIFYKMHQAAPDKVLMEAPSAGRGATCQSCAHCPWMSLNHLESLRDCLQDPERYRVVVDPAHVPGARQSLERMADFT